MLESEQLKQVNKEGDCLQFWYYLHEKNSSDGTHILVNMYQEGQEDRIELKKLSGDHGEVWRLDRTPLKSDVNYKVGIESIFNETSLNYIFIVSDPDRWSVVD